MQKVLLSIGVVVLILVHLGGTTTVLRRDTTDVASAKYDSGGSSYGSGGGGSYGGSGYSSGSYGSGGYSSGGGGGYGGSGGGGYGSSGGGGGYGGGGGSYGGGGYGEGGGGGEGESGGGDSGGGGSYDSGNVYYYYYPASSSSSNSYKPPAYYYPMMNDGGKDKDKESGLIGSLIGLSIPAILAVVIGIPILLLGLAAIAAAIAFFIGRSNDGASTTGIGGLVDLHLIQTVHEAFAAYQALSTDENCRQRVICELGYILKTSDKRATVVSVLDAMLPSSLQKHFKPLKEVMSSGESGKCQKYVCNAAAAALKSGPFKSFFGIHSKGNSTATTTTSSSTAPSPGQDAEAENSPPDTTEANDNH